MKKDIGALGLRLASLTEQVRKDHQHLLLGLATERDATREALQRVWLALDRQYELMESHTKIAEQRFEELAGMIRQDADLREEIEAIKTRLDRLESPPAA